MKHYRPNMNMIRGSRAVLAARAAAGAGWKVRDCFNYLPGNSESENWELYFQGQVYHVYQTKDVYTYHIRKSSTWVVKAGLLRAHAGQTGGAKERLIVGTVITLLALTSDIHKMRVLCMQPDCILNMYWNIEKMKGCNWGWDLGCWARAVNIATEEH